MTTFLLKDILEIERQQLLLRRQKLGLENADAKPDEANWFGIALSGGGIRSATINLGFLKTLNRFGILRKADYLSTVSGGGYTHSYIQATLKETGDFNKLFTDEHTAAFRAHGEYMIPGQGFGKYGNFFLLTVAFVVSWLMSLVSPVVVGGILFYVYKIGEWLIGENTLADSYVPDNERILNYGMCLVGGIFVLHFVANILLNFSLGVSKLFNKMEAVLATVGIGIYVWILVWGYEGVEQNNPSQLLDYAINAVLLFIIGFFVNPNALSFHRYYRKQLADLYLKFAKSHDNITLKDVFNASSDRPKDYIAPYPLINTCLNLQNPGGDEKFKGTKASDYFLLSPLFCGSKLTDYVRTQHYRDYRNMTLPAAVTISAAAVNPGMGIYSNKMLSVMMTVFNARLGFWISNPLKLKKSRAIVWWPVYFFKELLGRIGTNNKMVNISDGGHIENLGAYELLRRGCRLIVAFDAGEDKIYSFFDLNNLIIRARNELGLEIRFRDGHQPESVIRPEPSRVYSKQRYAIADIYQWWEDCKTLDAEGNQISNIRNFDPPKKVGTFVYVKSSVTAPTGKPDLDPKADPLKYGTYKYKIYHPDFPHEPTSDQFFDEIQWESYYQLGQFIGADVLGAPNPSKFDTAAAPDFSVKQLIEYFDDPAHFPLFDAAAARAAAPPDNEYETFREPAAGAEPPAAAAEPPKAEAEYRM